MFKILLIFTIAWFVSALLSYTIVVWLLRRNYAIVKSECIDSLENYIAGGYSDDKES